MKMTALDNRQSGFMEPSLMTAVRVGPYELPNRIAERITSRQAKRKTARRRMLAGHSQAAFGPAERKVGQQSQ